MRGLTPGQRTVLLVLALLVLAVFAALIVTLRSVMQVAPPPSLTPAVVPTRVTPSPSSPPPLPTPTLDPELLPEVYSARLMERIADRTGTLRQLQPLRAVPYTFIDMQETARYLYERYQRQNLLEWLNAYLALGLIDRVPDPPTPRVVSQAEQMVGLYDADEEQLYVVAGRGTSMAGEAMLAHAYVHALQDQHFDAYQRLQGRTLDEQLALRGLIEGDALLLTAQYLGIDQGSPDAGADWESLIVQAAGAEQPSYRDLLDADLSSLLYTAPYRHGLELVRQTHASGGWGAVDLLYARPPSSTEQLLHPGAGQTAVPVDVVLPNLLAVLGPGWNLALDTTVGEYLTGLLLSRNLLDPQEGWDAAAGWGGDRLQLWQDEQGQRVVVWKSAWDSTPDAIQFRETYARSLMRLQPGLVRVEAPQGFTGQWWRGGQNVVHLNRTTGGVVVVWGPDLETAMAVVEGL